jgi:hypothetical protein
MKLTTHFHLVSRLKLCGIVSLFPLRAYVSGYGIGDPELPSVRGYNYPVSGRNTFGDPPGWALGVRLATSPFKKIVENLITN